MKTAFTESAVKKIATTAVVNSARSTNPAENASKWNNGANRYASNKPLKDKIFLLSEQEVTLDLYGFGPCDVWGKDNPRIRTPTAFAGAGFGNEGWWWLSSPDCDDAEHVRTVRNDGRADTDTFFMYVNLKEGGVVPALCLE